MAKKKTTTRKTSDKKTKEMRNLTELEMMQIELNNAKVKVAELSYQNKELRKQLSDLRLSSELLEASKTLGAVKLKRKEFNDNLKEDIGIESETFGFDPITGEIK